MSAKYVIVVGKEVYGPFDHYEVALTSEEYSYPNAQIMLLTPPVPSGPEYTYTKVRNIDHLKEMALSNVDNRLECVKQLGYGCKSSVVMGYDEAEDKWYIWNLVDDTDQELTSDELFDGSLTNIGEAINKGALFVEEY